MAQQLRNPRQKIVVFFNHRGGTGKTSLATHLCFLAEARGISTMALSLDDQADIIRWVTRGQSVTPGRLYECGNSLSALYSPGRMPPDVEEDLVVVDMSAWSGNVGLTAAHLWLVPVFDRFAVQNSMNVMNAMQILPGGVGKFLVYNRTGAGGLRHSRALQKAGAAIDELPGWPVTISDNDVMLRAQMKCQAVWDVSFGRGSELDTDLRKFASLVFQRLGLRGQRA